MAVVFKDYSLNVKNALDETAIAFLYKVAGEIEAQTIRNSSKEKYKDKMAQQLWDHRVDEREKSATIGSPEEAAYWEEFGTGEHALYGNGRKGWWVYVEGNDKSRSEQNQYTQKVAEAIAKSMQRKGLKAHATNGRKPNRPLFRAFKDNKAKIKKMAEQFFKEGME